MGIRVSIVRGGIIAIGAAVGLVAADSSLAGPVGGGGHAVAGGHVAVGGGFRGGYYGGARGGYYGGYRGGWVGRPYYGGWHGYYGGYYGWRGCCGWGWGLPWVGLGLYVSALPFGYSTVWWDGVPYYYANNYYYVWDSGAGQYQAVEPPSGVNGSSSSPAPRATTPSNSWTDLYAYPKAGQSTEQQAKDRDECHKWAVAQTGFDPSQPTHDSQSDWAAKREGYLRAESACLTARNYSVK